MTSTLLCIFLIRYELRLLSSWSFLGAFFQYTSWELRQQILHGNADEAVLTH